MRAVFAVAILALLVLCVAPVLLVLADSFVSAEGGLTLGHYAAALSRSDLLRSLKGSLLLAVSATLLSLVIGVPFAVFTTRVRTPLRGLFSALYVLPLVLPPLLMAIGWTQFVRAVQGRGAAATDSLMGGLSGATMLFALAHFPFVVLFSRKAFLEIGAGLEEAARTSVGPVRAFLRITLPLAAPSVLAGALFVFLFTIADFSVVDYLSTVLPVKERVATYPFTAFSAWQTNYGELGRRAAAALGAPIAGLSLLLLGGIYWLLGKGRYVTVTSGHVRPRDLEEQSAPWAKAAVRGIGFVYVAGLLVLAVGIPIGRLVREAMGNDGDLVRHLRDALLATGEATGGGLAQVGNSLVFAAIAAAAMCLLAPVLAHHMVRKGPRREALIFTLSMLPLAFGPIMFGVGLIRMWNQPWLEVERHNPIYDTGVIVVFLLVGKYLPFALAAVTSSMKRVDPGYEEAAAVSGAGRLRRMLTVVSPLVARGIAAGFVLGFVFALRELDTIVLFSAGNDTAMKKIYQWVHFAHDANVAALSLVLVVLIALPLVLFWLLTARRIRVL
jgi:iron(III) transport system permease protein